jgi:hypothetical protein
VIAGNGDGEIDIDGAVRRAGMFVARLGPDGTSVWSAGVAADGPSRVRHVALAADGSTHVGGDFSGRLSVGRFELGEPLAVNAAPTSDGFVLRLDASGVVDRAEAITGPGFQEVRGLAIRADDGALIVAGVSDDETTIGAGKAQGRVFMAALRP